MSNYKMAFVFMNIGNGKDREVIEEVRKLPNVSEAYELYGVWDGVAKIEGGTLLDQRCGH